MRRNKSQTLLPIFWNEKGQNCNSAQNSLQSSPSKPCRRKLSKKYFQARSSSTALLSFKSEKLSRKYESLSKMMDEFIEGCSKQEVIYIVANKCSSTFNEYSK